MNTNNIDGKLLKNSLLDLEGVSSLIKENVAGATKELVNESIKEMMSKLITESDSDSEDDDDEEEVKDTFSDDAEPVEDDEDGTEDDEEPVSDESEFSDDEDEIDQSDDDDSLVGPEDNSDEGWDEFDKYKVGDREYDFTGADEADLQSVYSILRNDDSIEVRQDGDDVYKVDNGETEFIVIPTNSTSDNCEGGECQDGECQDGECEFNVELGDDEDSEDDTTFSVELGDDEAMPNDTAEDEVEDDDEKPINDEKDNYVKESKIMRNNTIFEIALNEDDNLGYGMKQDKPAFTTPNDKSFDGGDTDEWDDGVPHGDDKPNLQKKATPFTTTTEGRRMRGRRINEDVYGDFENTEVWDTLPEDEGPDAPDEETVTPFTNAIGGPLKEGIKTRTRWNKRHANKSASPYEEEYEPDGEKMNSRYGEYKQAKVSESIIRRTNKILKENKALRSALNKFEKSINEASVANVNLQNIVKLVTENTTSANEKKSIREQFAKVKTVNESNMLYNQIKNTLNGGSKKSVNESVNKQQVLSAKPARTAEKVIYKSNDLKESLDLMSRMNKILL